MSVDHRNLRDVPTGLLLSEVARRRRALQTSPPRREVLHPCRYCGEIFGTVRRRKHEPRCRKAHGIPLGSQPGTVSAIKSMKMGVRRKKPI